MNDERQLWRVGDFACVMISCCAGAELQIRRVRAAPGIIEGTTDAATDREIVLREMYPTKSDLYERARRLKTEYAGTPMGRRSQR